MKENMDGDDRIIVIALTSPLSDLMKGSKVIKIDALPGGGCERAQVCSSNDATTGTRKKLLGDGDVKVDDRKAHHWSNKGRFVDM
jgi:hypothetical protein